MFQKENQSGLATRQRRDRKGVASKITGEGNDYVLKRYRLEQNKLFRQKQNEELKYETKFPKSTTEEDEEIEDDLVIVPIDIPQPLSLDPDLHTSLQSEKEAHQIFIFDDEQQEAEEQEIEEISCDSQIESFQSSTFEQKSHEEEISIKTTYRTNYSNAELVTPKSRQFAKKNNEVDPNQVLEKLCKNEVSRERSGPSKAEEEGLEHLKGVKIGKESNSKIVSITITDKKVFSISKLPSGIILQCIIKRTSSILNLMSPEFDLYLANGLKHILSAKKYPLRNRELFKFSVDPLKFNEANQLAVMHANVNHNIYWVLDQPRRIGDMDLSFIYLVIGYYKLKGQEHHQRKFTALLPPTANSEYQLAMDYELNNINFSNMKEEIKTEVSNLQRWDNQSYNSTKNCVLADEDDPDYRYLEMRKESDDVFELTVQHPLSPLQAMAIAMSRFDAQLK